MRKRWTVSVVWCEYVCVYVVIGGKQSIYKTSTEWVTMHIETNFDLIISSIDSESNICFKPKEFAVETLSRFHQAY